jgi:hypothetical protein
MRKVILSIFALFTACLAFGQDAQQIVKIGEAKEFFEQLANNYNFFDSAEDVLRVKIPQEFNFLSGSTITLKSGARVKFNQQYDEAHYTIDNIGDNLFVLLNSQKLSVKFEFLNSNNNELVFRYVEFSATGF